MEFSLSLSLLASADFTLEYKCFSLFLPGYRNTTHSHLHRSITYIGIENYFSNLVCNDDRFLLVLLGLFFGFTLGPVTAAQGILDLVDGLPDAVAVGDVLRLVKLAGLTPTVVAAANLE